MHSETLLKKLSFSFKLFYSIFEKRLRSLSKQLLLDYDNLSTTLFSMGDVFANLFNISQSFNNNTFSQNFADNVYLNLNNLVVNWGI